MKKALWAIILVCLVVLALLPFANLVTLGANSLSLDWSARASLEQLAQFGDFFGGHTAAFSGLLSVALILYFSLQQKELQQEHFEEQLRISKQASDLASITNIYGHYGESYGKTDDETQILEHVAKGHRRWAIRESFSIIDPGGALEAQRREQVDRDFRSLIQTLDQERLMLPEFRRVAELTSSLLMDKRLTEDRRSALWGLYEILREDPSKMIKPGTEMDQRFVRARQFIVEKYLDK